MFKYFLPLCLFLAACDTYVEEQRSVDFEPVYLEPLEEEETRADFGGIYQKDKGNLFAMEARAHRATSSLSVVVVVVMLFIMDACCVFNEWGEKCIPTFYTKHFGRWNATTV